MKFDWRLYDYERDFFGESAAHTRLSLSADTSLGLVKLQLRVVWEVPLSRWSYRLPVLSGVSLRKNHCRTFTVVLPSESSRLEQRTLEYFDGEGSEFTSSNHARVLFCDPKWAASATKMANRYGSDIARGRIALQRFMERRLLNAYSSL